MSADTWSGTGTSKKYKEERGPGWVLGASRTPNNGVGDVCFQLNSLVPCQKESLCHQILAFQNQKSGFVSRYMRHLIFLIFKILKC